MRKRIIENKTYFLILLFAILITIPKFIPSLNVDAYCTSAGKYLGSIERMLQSGRIFTASFYYIFNLIKLPIEYELVLSSILTNIVLSLSVYKLYKTFKTKNNKFLLIGCFLVFYNPITLEIFMFIESFIMAIGIYFSLLSAIAFCKIDNKYRLFKSLVYAILSVLCYQGTMCFLIPLSFLIYIINYSNDKLKADISNIIKQGFLIACIYGVSLIFSYIVVQVFNTVMPSSTDRVGAINLILNFKHTIYMIKWVSSRLYNYINYIYYYITILLLIIVAVILKIKHKKYENKKSILYMIIIVLLCYFMPFVPNLALNMETNYTAARMAGTIGSIIGFISIFYSIYFAKEFNINSILIIIVKLLIFVFFIFNAYQFLYNNYANVERYKNDIFYLTQLKSKILSYEHKNQIKINNIYYAYADNSNNYYTQFNLRTLFNERVHKVNWAMSCYINNYSNANYIEMSFDDKQQFFNEENYNTYNKNRFIFINDNLYLIIY